MVALRPALVHRGTWQFHCNLHPTESSGAITRTSLTASSPSLQLQHPILFSQPLSPKFTAGYLVVTAHLSSNWRGFEVGQQSTCMQQGQSCHRCVRVVCWQPVCLQPHPGLPTWRVTQQWHCVCTSTCDWDEYEVSAVHTQTHTHRDGLSVGRVKLFAQARYLVCTDTSIWPPMT